MAVKFEFAKIFELKEQQVLITKREDDDKYEVVQTSDFGDFQTSLALGFEDEKKREECFNTYNLDNAQKFLDIINGMMGG